METNTTSDRVNLTCVCCSLAFRRCRYIAAAAALPAVRGSAAPCRSLKTIKRQTRKPSMSKVCRTNTARCPPRPQPRLTLCETAAVLFWVLTPSMLTTTAVGLAQKNPNKYKMKTRKAVAKRFVRLGGGGLKRWQANRGHLSRKQHASLPGPKPSCAMFGSHGRSVMPMVPSQLS